MYDLCTFLYEWFTSKKKIQSKKILPGAVRDSEKGSTTELALVAGSCSEQVTVSPSGSSKAVE